MSKDSGKAFIFSAPSGSGKTTIVNHLLKKHPELSFSISATTRDKRPNEVDQKDYYFLSQQEFESRLHNHEFIEWEEVYRGLYYGTLVSEVNRIWQEGKHVVFDVDVKGGIALKKYFGDKALSIFVKVGSIEELEKRLKARGTESQESLNKRIQKASQEMTFENEFDEVIINDNLEDAFDKAEDLYSSFI